MANTVQQQQTLHAASEAALQRGEKAAQGAILLEQQPAFAFGPSKADSKLKSNVGHCLSKLQCGREAATFLHAAI